MFLKNVKITHKVLAVIIVGIIISSIFAFWAVLIGKKQTIMLERIYVENVKPLDNLRGIQLIFRELEYRMAGVQADVVGAIPSGRHLGMSLKTADILWNDAKNVMKGYDLSDKATKKLETFEKAYKNFKENVAEDLEKVYLDNEPEKVEDLYDEYLDIKPFIFKSIDDLANNLKDEVKEYYMESQKSITKMNTSIAFIGIFALGLFLVLALLIVRSINKPIHKVVDAAEQIAKGDFTQTLHIDTEDEMGSMAARLNIMIEHLGNSFSNIIAAVEKMTSQTEGLSGLSEKLLHGAKEQNEKVEQIAVATTEMSQTIMDMANNTSDASEATKVSFETATAGKEVVSHTVVSITKLADSVSEASNSINSLGSSLNEIGVIVSAIKDIADQTNLLALNAAIEAARSGEHGRGFAVVADEVKKLAERTSKATEEIASKIVAIQAKSGESISTMEKGKSLVEESVDNATQAGDALQKIVESSDKVTDMVQRVAAATEEQSAVSEQVSSNMEQISMIIKNHFRESKELQKLASNLANLAQEVMSQIMHFKTKNNGNTAMEATHNKALDAKIADNSIA